MLAPFFRAAASYLDALAAPMLDAGHPMRSHPFVWVVHAAGPEAHGPTSATEQETHLQLGSEYQPLSSPHERVLADICPSAF